MDNSDPSTDSDGYHGTHEAGSAERGDEAETYHGTHEGSGTDEGEATGQGKPGTGAFESTRRDDDGQE